MKLKTVIMAGGKGTRISSIASDIPKPMIDICGKPILLHQLESLSNQGIKEVTLVVGHLGNIIKSYFGNGEKYNIKIEYLEETKPLGTAGSLRNLINEKSEAILLINGDLIFEIDIQRMYEYHLNKNAEITLFTHPNSHPYDSALIEIAKNGRIVKWINKEDKKGSFKNRVNAGIHILNSEIISSFPNYDVKEKLDLDRDILKHGLKKYKIFAYDSPEYVKDMGTPERYIKVKQEYIQGVPFKKSLKNRQSAVFLDRDGTINKENGFINKISQFALIDNAAEAIRKINDSGKLAIVVTNQPVIARGECSVEELKNIHNQLELLLGNEGAYLDDIIYCPHHPDKGFEGECTQYKIDCECRKPKPGMLYNMAEKYNIDLSSSYMIGDSEKDIMAGIAAGCKTIYIGREVLKNCKADYQAVNLLCAVDIILMEG